MYDLSTVEAICNEKDRLIVRRAKPLVHTPEEALRIFDKIRTCRRVTGWGDPRTIGQLLDPTHLVWLIDDVGIIIFCPLDGETWHGHIFFWDRRLRGRESICRAVMHWASRNFGIRFFVTAIGEEFRATIAFAKRLGFSAIKTEHGKIALVLQM